MMTQAALSSSPQSDMPTSKELLQTWQSLADLQTQLFGQMGADVRLLTESVEADVGGMLSSFQQLSLLGKEQNARLEKVVETATTVTVGEEKLPLNEFGHFIDSTLNNVIMLTIHYSKQAMDMVYRLGGVVQSLDKIDRLIDGVGEVNRKTTMLALNATIEAERAGEAGKTFQVVAREVRDLATRVDSLAGDIRTEMEVINGGIRETHHLLVEFAGTDMSPTLLAEERMQQMMRALLVQNERLSQYLRESMQTAERSAELSSLVTNFQFQDRLTQSLDHIADTLSLFEKQVRRLSRDTRSQAYAHSEERQAMAEKLLDTASALPVDNLRRNNLHRLLNDYKTSAWHDLVHGKSKAATAAADEDIELF